MIERCDMERQAGREAATVGRHDSRLTPPALSGGGFHSSASFAATVMNTSSANALVRSFSRHHS